jgi:hypothetical protein
LIADKLAHNYVYFAVSNVLLNITRRYTIYTLHVCGLKNLFEEINCFAAAEKRSLQRDVTELKRDGN